MWRSPSRSPAVVVATWLEGHKRGIAPVVAPPAAKLDYPDDVQFGLFSVPKLVFAWVSEWKIRVQIRLQELKFWSKMYAINFADVRKIL